MLGRLRRRRGTVVGLGLVLALCTSCAEVPAGHDRSAACVDPAQDTTSAGWLCDLPTVDPAALTTAQAALWSVVQQAFAAQQPGTAYSQGVDEAWCADFVSWVFDQAGHPYRNPSSGSWRIPGTFTLTEYFQSLGAFHDPAEPGLVPRLGDVAVYDQDSSVWGQHTNIVLAFDGTWLVTVGGNQPHGNVTVYRHRWDDPGLHLRGLGRPLPG